MTRLHYIPSEAAMDAYRYTLTGERIGWVLFDSPHSFAHAHCVLVDPEVGPVIIVADEVYEVDPDSADVFPSEEEAVDAYWVKKNAVQGSR